MIKFILFTDDLSRQLSLQSEIHSSIRTAKKKHKHSLHLLDPSSTDDSDLEQCPRQQQPPCKLKNTFATYKLATANKMHIGGMSSDSPIPIYNPGLGSSLETKGNVSLSPPPPAFTMELESKTSDTLTMTPAGSHMHNLSIFSFPTVVISFIYNV